MILTSALAMLMLQAAAPAAPAAAPQPVTKASTQAGVKANFEKLDANKDGWVDRPEVERVRDANLAARRKARTDQVSATFGKLDTNKDGSLSRQEFDGLFAPVPAAQDVPWLTSNDVNKDGRVSLAEVTSQALAEFDRLDRDRNGTLSPQERQAPARAQQGARPPQAAPRPQSAPAAQGR